MRIRRDRSLPGFLLVLMLLSAGSGWGARSGQIALHLAKDKPPLNLGLVRSGGPGEEDYLFLSTLLEALGGEGDWDREGRRVTIILNGHEAVLTLDSPVASLDGQSVNLKEPCRYQGGRLLVPVSSLPRLFVGMLGPEAGWDAARQELYLYSEEPKGPGGPEGRKKLTRITTVVVDAGHGGDDPGALGPQKLQEKEINLALALRVKTLLEQTLGLRVILTREDDTFIPLRERTKVANRVGASLFLSIHCNAAPRKRKKGAVGGGSETYFLSLARTDEARAVEAMENAAVRFEQPDTGLKNFDDVQFILWDMAQNEYLQESEQLAGEIQDAMGKWVPVENRGVNQAGFYVLRGAYMPAVLVETAFISNPAEAKLLSSASGQDRIARAIAEGVSRFKKTYERRMQ